MFDKTETDPLLKKTDSYNSLSLVSIFAVLLVIGAANLYSASNGDFYFYNQLKHIFVGLFGFGLFAWLIPLRQVNTYSYPFFWIITLSLFLVLFVGHSAGGAQRWISLGGFKFQPSEIAKLSIAMMVARFFYQNKQVYAFSIMDLWPVLFGSILTFILVFKQPDFGTAGVCLIIAVVQLFFIRIPLSLPFMLSSVIGSIAMSFLGWHFFLKSYQKLRILNLINPNMDPTNSGYNSLQSLVAIGSGHQFGKGFQQGTQTQLQFLPARHTDFIFAVFAEEHGFWGSLTVFFLFGAIAYLSLEISRNAKDVYGSMLAIGIGALFFVEFTINVAMVLGIFPVVGMPLPFFSYGGTSLITLCLAIGLLVNVDRDSRKAHGRKK